MLLLCCGKIYMIDIFSEFVVPNIENREMNFWMSEELKQSNFFVIRHYPIKFNLLRSNINQKLLFDSTISGTRTYRCCRLGLIVIKHTSFRIIIPVKVLWKYSRTHLEESIPPYIKIHIPTLFLFLSRKLYSSLI